jgi:hypothetical protein
MKLALNGYESQYYISLKDEIRMAVRIIEEDEKFIMVENKRGIKSVFSKDNIFSVFPINQKPCVDKNQ